MSLGLRLLSHKIIALKTKKKKEKKKRKQNNSTRWFPGVLSRFKNSMNQFFKISWFYNHRINSNEQSIVYIGKE